MDRYGCSLRRKPPNTPREEDYRYTYAKPHGIHKLACLGYSRSSGVPKLVAVPPFRKMFRGSEENELLNGVTWRWK